MGLLLGTPTDTWDAEMRAASQRSYAARLSASLSVCQAA